MDLVLRIAGVILAAGSIMFATAMIGLNRSAGLMRVSDSVREDVRPEYAGGVDFDRSRAGRHVLDFTALGSIRAGSGPRVLPDFELIDCDGVTAQIRLPQGRVVRARAGSRLAGAGEILSISRGHDGWVVTAREGRIVPH